MNNKIITLSKYRLEKAKEDLLSAKINSENGLLKASINRSYYAIFHSIRAVNALNEFDSKKHSGVIAYFNQHFIHERPRGQVKWFFLWKARRPKGHGGGDGLKQQDDSNKIEDSRPGKKSIVV